MQSMTDEMLWNTPFHWLLSRALTDTDEEVAEVSEPLETGDGRSSAGNINDSSKASKTLLQLVIKPESSSRRTNCCVVRAISGLPDPVVNCQ
jgi:hypothetical protein